jgi:hypothetical protein
MQTDLRKFTQDIFQRLQVYIKPVVEHLENRIEAIEAKELPSDLVRKSDLENAVSSANSAIADAVKDTVDPEFLEAQLKQFADEIRADIPTAIKGDPGEKGEKGDRGLKGERGEKGETGEKGDKGDRGLKGEKGEKGEQGPAGDRGQQGEKGDRGEKGDVGEQGEKGERGEKGEPGDTGPAGPPGKSISSEAVQLMVNAAVEKHMSELVLPTPLDIDVLPRIDESKSYPRGTYASHKGGVWKADQQTEGMDGWRCILNGFPGTMDVDFEDARNCKITLHKAHGEPEYIELKTPALIYRGVYKEKELDSYDAGDVVSNNGSIWIAVSKPKKAPGMGSPEETGWQLSVKRGRDGKSA